LPLAVQRQLGLGQFIDAFALGYEVGARCGAWLRLAPGVHADGNWPVLGVACAAAALLGMDEEGIARAMDIAGCRLASSLYLPIRTGRTVRNVYLAHCASSGIDAALQARAGISAPSDALGYYAEHYIPAAHEPLPGPEVDMLLEAYQKPFAAVRHVHYGAIAAQRIREKLGGQISQVSDIELVIYEEAIAYCDNPRPQTLLAGQFSLTFGVAAALRFGTLDAQSYDDTRFRDPGLRRLEGLVRVTRDGELTARRERGALLRVRTGATTLEVRVPQDDPALVLTDEGIVAKFAAGAEATIATEHSRRFCDAWLKAPRETPVAALWNDFSQAAGSRAPR
jgi:2-methylcitrate dehydratase PrpD